MKNGVILIFFPKNQILSFLNTLRNHIVAFDVNVLLEKTGNELWINIEWKERLAVEQFCLTQVQCFAL